MKVEELLNRKAIRYKKSGRDFLVQCLNPEHDDSNPSMRIDIVLGIYNCLSCGYSGNIFKLFGEVANATDISKEKIRRKIEQIRALSVGLSMPNDAVLFVGTYRGISPETYAKFGAFKTETMGMKERLVFPIRSNSGEINVFHGRDLTGHAKPKYYNYPAHIKLPLFPTPAPITGKIVLVEGIFDMLNLHDKGLPNAVSCFGISTLKAEDFSNLKLTDVDGIDILFDPDEAGSKGADNAKKLLEDLGFMVRKITMPAGKDPGDMTDIEVTKLRRTLYG